jgi:hypothetical protein
VRIAIGSDHAGFRLEAHLPRCALVAEIEEDPIDKGRTT